MIEQQIVQVAAGFEKTLRVEEITIGETYVIRPLNARKSNFDNQTCTLVRFIATEDNQLPYAGVVSLQPSNRYVQVELVDLASTKRRQHPKRTSHS